MLNGHNPTTCLNTLDKCNDNFYLYGMNWDEEIDAAGLLCPLPVLKARKRLMAMVPGSILRLITTDPAALIDIPHYCHESGDELLGSTVEGDSTVYLIRKAGA